MLQRASNLTSPAESLTLISIGVKMFIIHKSTAIAAPCIILRLFTGNAFLKN